MPRCSLSDFTDGYLVAALWSSTDGDTPLDQDHDIDDIAPETRTQMLADCTRFFIENEDSILCDDGPTGNDGPSQAAMAGHDFWLTRCGHGAGFWDGDWPEPHAAKLTAAAEAFGNVDLYVIADQIHA